MKRIDLCGEWKLTGCEQRDGSGELSLTATVPGNIPLDLSRAGILPEDLYFGLNMKEAEKYETYRWTLERTFSYAGSGKNLFLVFRAVDCIAEYFLNGEKIGESRDALIPFSFDVSGKVKNGENRLTVVLSSPTLAAQEQDDDLFCLSHAWHGTDAQHIRRPAHSYGWDIMPRAVAAGIWRKVYLEERDDLSFSQLFIDTSRLHTLSVYYAIDGTLPVGVPLFLRTEIVKGKEYFTKEEKISLNTGSFSFSLPNPDLWWPHGYGKHPLYTATFRIMAGNREIHKKEVRFGIRNVALERTDTTDGKNGKFHFSVNGVQVMLRGSNWIPLDVFHSRDRERLAPALDLARDIGCNVLRVWGGGVYEDHPFFDFCDENGILVWQDFAMACSAYPEDEAFCDLLNKEAVSVVREYRQHPSLLLWSGDNEVDVMLSSTVDPNRNRLTRQLLADVVFRNDIGRPYLPSSPFLSEKAYAENATPPEAHLWGARDYYKAPYYKESKAHFVSETGYHGCPSPASIRKFISPDRVFPYTDNEEWNFHSTDQKNSPHRTLLMEKQVRQLFGEVPKDLETYSIASQISQAEADKYFIERIRIKRPVTSGVIFWNLLDGWPQMSDAVVDYYFEKKLAYRYIKRAQAPFCVIAGEMEDWCHRLYACNDTLEEKRGTLRVCDADSGECLLETAFVCPPNMSRAVGTIRLYYSERRLLLFRWTANGEEGQNHYLCGFPPFDLRQYRAWIERGLL